MRGVCDNDWRLVFRTGRTQSEMWEDAFGLPNSPVLDVGAGDSPWVAQLLLAGIPAVALDPQYFLEPPEGQAWDLIRKTRLGTRSRHRATDCVEESGAVSPTSARAVRAHVRAVAGIAQGMPFRDASFGTVYMSYSLQHIRDPVAALRECLRVARADGRVLLHPVWVRGPRLVRANSLLGVTLVEGRRLPRRRPSLSLDPSVLYSDAALREVALAVTPSPPVRFLGSFAMRWMIRLRGTNRMGPGAIR
jgi:SAM-dependent methyltransferase